MSIPDTPIKNTENDRLNRGVMSKHVAKLVNDFDSVESFVVGIEGEWGSGKTSFINLVKAEIDPEKALVMDFNPWNFSSQDQLIEDFFDELFSKIMEAQPKSKIGKTIKQYKRKLKKVDYNINPSLFGFSLGSANVSLSSLSSLRTQLETELGNLDRKIMIVIDDIDRLDTTETLAIFKLVKVTANFPNCIFFLAYDRKRVITRVDKATNDSGEDYLKKIIQTTFRLPPISRSQIKTMVTEHINMALADVYGDIKLDEENQKRWDSIHFNGFSELFQNIRDLKRYASSLKLNVSVIGKHEINVVDFVTLEAIRVFAPDFYDEIPKNRWLFTNSIYGLTFARDRDAKRTDEYKKITDSTLEKHPQKEKIIEIAKELFPYLSGMGHYGSDWDEIWAGNKQVCADSKFEVYFQLSVPPDEISEEEFEGMIEKMSDQNLTEVVEVIKKINSDNKLKNFLKKVHERFGTTYETKPNFFRNVSDALFSMFDELPVDTEGFLDFDGVDRQLERLVWRISEKITGEEARYNFIKETISKSTHLYPKVELIRVLKREKAGHAEHLDDMKKVLDRTVNDLLPEVQQAIDNDTLKNEYRADRMIWAYKEWGKENEIKDYFKKLAESKKDVFVVLRWLKSRVSSSNRGIYYRIDKKTLEHFVDISIFDKTIDSLNLSELTEQEKNLYDLYKQADKDEW